jgi:hypothetical protein
MDIGRDVGERVWESSFCRQLLFGSNVVEYYFCVETFKVTSRGTQINDQTVRWKDISQQDITNAKHR